MISWLSVCSQTSLGFMLCNRNAPVRRRVLETTRQENDQPMNGLRKKVFRSVSASNLTRRECTTTFPAVNSDAICRCARVPTAPSTLFGLSMRKDDDLKTKTKGCTTEVCAQTPKQSKQSLLQLLHDAWGIMTMQPTY